MKESYYIQKARAYLGRELISLAKNETTSGIIVEIELYLQNDPASHSFVGKTQRNKAMFEAEGTIYVYLIYGIHYCFNISLGDGNAILIRALEPKVGIDTMKQRRGITDIKNLTNGPAKLTQALAIDKSFDGLKLNSSNLKLLKKSQDFPIQASQRIGISKAQDKLFRFFIPDNLYLSTKI